MIKVDRSEFGKGLFATEPIPAKVIITIVSGKPLTFQQTLALGNKESHTLQISTDEYILCEVPFLYSNHSCDPNCGLSDMKLVTLRPIKPGEELLWDYSTSMLERHWEMKCHCKSSQCRKLIQDFDLLPGHVQKKYLDRKIVLPFIVQYLAQKAWSLSA